MGSLHFDPTLRDIIEKSFFHPVGWSDDTASRSASPTRGENCPRSQRRTAIFRVNTGVLRALNFAVNAAVALPFEDEK